MVKVNALEKWRHDGSREMDTLRQDLKKNARNRKGSLRNEECL